MKIPVKVLVFPCGSEVGLEVFQCLSRSRHVELWGAGSTKDHGDFLYSNYISGLPYVTDKDFIESIRKTVNQYEIDVLIPTMESALVTLKVNEAYLNCKIMSSPLDTVLICNSKLATYERLSEYMKTPAIYNKLNDVNEYPVFLKPDIGYGSRNSCIVNNDAAARVLLRDNTNTIICEYLPGNEYTIDCFSDRNGSLRYYYARKRNRIKHGISVNSTTAKEHDFEQLSKIINKVLRFRGAWFFQMKENSSGDLVLLEVASRIGGSSGLSRARGVNLPLLSLFDLFDVDVSISPNEIEVESDRALTTRFKHNYVFNTAYVDFDDCLIINNQVNVDLIKLLFVFRNKNKRIVLITKHQGNIEDELTKYRLNTFFDQIIHIKNNENKSDYIKERESAVFIDDSFAERESVLKTKGVPVFSLDMLEVLFEC